jgi:hypothetical protein
MSVHLLTHLSCPQKKDATFLIEEKDDLGETIDLPIGGHYRHIYTTNIILKRRKIYNHTHIYLCHWHVSTCTSRNDINVETEAGNRWNIIERRHSGKHICKKGKKPIETSTTGLAHHVTELEAQRTTDQAKIGWCQATLGAGVSRSLPPSPILLVSAHLW